MKIEYVPAETRAVAIHEAGHAVASHVYMKDVLSTRLSIRKRGGWVGHHQAIEKEERFYGENSTGVGGDVQSATQRAAWMVGACGMGPEPVSLDGRVPTAKQAEREAEIMERFEKIGAQIMRRELHGDEVVDLLDSQRLKLPETGPPPTDS